MSKKLIVGDIHGHVDVLEKSIDYADKNGYEFIQVGDLTDSFSKSVKNQKKCIEIARVASKDENKTFLLGNHDLAYLFPEYFWCSGVTQNKVGQFQSIYQEIEFDYYRFFKNILITHAGLSSLHLSWLADQGDIEGNGGSITDTLNEALESADHIYKAGFASGGEIPIGGIFWLRPWNFEPIKGLIQVFGHTYINGGGILHNHHKNYYNIDNIEYGKQELLAYEGGEFKIIKKKEYYT